MPDGNYHREREERERLERELAKYRAEDDKRRFGNSPDKADEQTRRLEDLIRGGVHPELTGISELTRQFIAAQGDLSKVKSLQSESLIQPGESTFRRRDHVFEDIGGATMVETRHLIPHLSKEAAEVELRARGIDIKLPQGWDKADVVHRNRYLQDAHALFSVADLGEAKKELILPEVGGGDAEIYWDNPLAEDVDKAVEDDETGEIKLVKESREVSLEEAIKRLVTLYEKSELPFEIEPPRKSISDQIEELSAHIKEKYLDKIGEAKKSKKDYPVISDLVRVIGDMKRKYELSEKGKYFEKIIDEKTRKEVMVAKLELDKHFQDKKKKDPERYALLFRSLNEAADQVNRMQDAGWFQSVDALKRNFALIADREIKKAVTEEEREMIKWQSKRLEEGFELHFLEQSVNQPPSDWRDSGRNLDKILRQLERTEFSDQQLQTTLSAAVRIVSQIPVKTLEGVEKEEAEKLQKHLEERLNAILAVNSFYSVMEHSSMDPEKVIGVFSGFKDETFQVFFERFNHNSKGEKIKYKDENGEEHDINLLSEGMNVYMKRLNRERKIMNYIEKWTRNIDVQPGKAEKDVKNECLAAIENITTRTGGSRKIGDIKDAVSGWYRENTLLGAHDEHTKDQRKDEMVGDLKMFEEKTDEEKAREEKRLWKEGLAEVLKDKYKIDDEQLKEMMDSGLIEQVMNNAYRLSWVMAWSDYDGIRIWDPKAENPAKPGTGRVAAFVYNGDTNLFFARAIDHVWEFFVDENRGKVPKSNLIMQDELLGDYGNLFPQNRTMVRFMGDALGKEATDKYIREKRPGFKNIGKLDMNNEPEEGWAKSALLAEGLDKGELSLENVNWTELFSGKGSWKYKWIDLYSDRNEMKSFTSPGKLQKYLQQPNTEAFLQLFSLDNFYSKREVRLQPAMKLAIPAHQRLGNFWKAWWGENDRMTHAEKEAIIEIALRTNRLDIKYKDWMKKEYLGWGALPGVLPVRSIRQISEAADVMSREFSTGVLWKDTWHVSKTATTTFDQMFKYAFSRTLKEDLFI